MGWREDKTEGKVMGLGASELRRLERMVDPTR